MTFETMHTHERSQPTASDATIPVFLISSLLYFI